MSKDWKADFYHHILKNKTANSLIFRSGPPAAERSRSHIVICENPCNLRGILTAKVSKDIHAVESS